MHFNLAHRQCLAALDYPAACQKVAAIGRCQQIQFDFRGQHILRRAKYTQGSVATSTVGNRGGNAGVQETILLRQIGAICQRDFDQTRRHGGDLCADSTHHCLAGKTGAYPFGILFINGWCG